MQGLTPEVEQRWRPHTESLLGFQLPEAFDGMKLLALEQSVTGDDFVRGQYEEKCRAFLEANDSSLIPLEDGLRFYHEIAATMTKAEKLDLRRRIGFPRDWL